jgi:hypothetical protein
MVRQLLGLWIERYNPHKSWADVNSSTRHKWESAVTAHLWPYAVRHAASILNETPCERLGFRTTLTQVFSRTAVEPNTTHWHPLFCPSYVLAQPLRAGNPYEKWKETAAPGIFLGFSPFHARTVALVLNPITGYVSCLIPHSPLSTVKTATRHRSVYGRQNVALQGIISRGLHTLPGMKPH